MTSSNISLLSLSTAVVVALLSITIVLLQQSRVALKMATAVETDKMAALATAANEARGLAMDSIAAAHSGHMGLPLGAAEIGASLWGSQVRTC
jgi:Na+/glutamate symporter